MVKPEENFTFSMCNPPFFSDISEKTKNVAQGKMNEFVTSLGGDFEFFLRYFEESKGFSKQVEIFTSLLGRKGSYQKVKNFLEIKRAQGIVEARYTMF